MLHSIRLRDVGPAPALEMTFAERLNILTGDNGLGKSFLLEIAWWSLTRTWPGTAEAGALPNRGPGSSPEITFELDARSKRVSFSSRYDFATQSWPSRRGRPYDPGMVLFARSDGGFSVWDPARNYYRNAPTRGVDAPDRPSAYHFTPQEVWNGLGPPERPVCNGLIRDWSFWQARNEESFQQLARVLEKLSPSGEERLRPGEPTSIDLDDARPIPTLRMAYGQDVPVTHASAGMKRIIALAYLLVWTWHEHQRASRLLNLEPTSQIVFLIDEIEAHLHPTWQRVILRALLEVMEVLTQREISIQVLAATHSPLLLASLEPLFDAERDALWVLDLVDGRVRLSREAWRRRGDANGWLTSHVFDLKEARSLEAEHAIQAALSWMRDPEREPGAYERLREALRRVLPDTDPFWIQWRLKALQLGMER